MSDPKKFVAELELSTPAHKMESLSTVTALQRALESGEEEEAQAFINNKSLVSFVAGVNGQNRQDVLNSTLIAQLAANKKFPNEKDLVKWYGAYTEVLTKIGWTMSGKDFIAVDTSKNLFEMENVVLDILGAAIGGSALAVVAKTLEAFRKLSNSDNRLVAFERNTHTKEKGSFQLALADETNGVVSLSMAGFVVSSSEQIKRIIFIRTTKEKTSLQVSSMTGTLNPDTYALVRQDILTKLGLATSEFIAGLEI